MSMKNVLIYFIFIYIGMPASSQTAAEILKNSIKYHDPNENWNDLQVNLNFDESRPDGEIRKTRVRIDNGLGYFKLNRGNKEIHGMLMDSCFIEKGNVSCERVATLRNYYLYLWGLPMKLLDEGTPLDPEASSEVYEGTAAYVLRVPYEKDTWYFYFSKENYRLLGYKFFQDTEEINGEWIKLRNEALVSGMKIPSERSWYTLPDMKYLGTDKLVSSE